MNTQQRKKPFFLFEYTTGQHSQWLQESHFVLSLRLIRFEGEYSAVVTKVDNVNSKASLRKRAHHLSAIAVTSQ